MLIFSTIQEIPVEEEDDEIEIWMIIVAIVVAILIIIIIGIFLYCVSDISKSIYMLHKADYSTS